jgi:hypothetical protein
MEHQIPLTPKWITTSRPLSVKEMRRLKRAFQIANGELPRSRFTKRGVYGTIAGIFVAGVTVLAILR